MNTTTNKQPKIDIRLKQPQEVNGYVYRFQGDCFWCDRPCFDEVHVPQLPPHRMSTHYPEGDPNVWYYEGSEGRVLRTPKHKQVDAVRYSSIPENWDPSRPVLGPNAGIEDFIAVHYYEFGKREGLVYPYDESLAYQKMETYVGGLEEIGLSKHSQLEIERLKKQYKASTQDEVWQAMIDEAYDELDCFDMFVYSDRVETAPKIVACACCVGDQWLRRSERHFPSEVLEVTTEVECIKDPNCSQQTAQEMMGVVRDVIRERQLQFPPDGLTEEEHKRLTLYVESDGAVKVDREVPSAHDRAVAFAEVWNSSASVQNVADALKITYEAVSQRARRYRNIGIDLKSMRKNAGRKPLNVDEINSRLNKS